MRIRYTIPAIALIAAVSAAPSSQNTVSMKCPTEPILFADAPEPVFVLDGKAVPLGKGSQQEQFNELGITPEAVESVHIVCASDVHRVFGIKANRTAIVVFTKPGPWSVLKNSVESIRVMQESYHAKDGRFAKVITDLPWKDETGLITVSLSLSQDGKQWWATGNHQYLFREIYGVSGKAEK